MIIAVLAEKQLKETIVREFRTRQEAVSWANKAIALNAHRNMQVEAKIYAGKLVETVK